MKSLNRRTAAPRTGTRRRLLATGALLCIGVMPLSACSLFNPPLERDESVHAVFRGAGHREDAPGRLPLLRRTNYEYTAFQIAMKQCYAEHGQNYTAGLLLRVRPAARWGESTVPGTSSTPGKSRLSEARPRQRRSAPISYQLGGEHEPTRKQAAHRMLPQGPRDPATPRCPKARGPRMKGSPQTVVSPPRRATPCYGQRTAAASSKRSGSGASPTAASPRARQAPSPRKPRWLSSSARTAVSTSPPPKRRFASPPSRPNVTSRSAWATGLYDLEAQYQMPLIRKHQSQLEQDRKAERERDEKFEQYGMEHQ